MKKVFLIAALTAVSFAGFSQDDEAGKKLGFSIGLEAAMPIGDAGDAYKFGIGGSAQADYMVADKFAVTLNAGYISLSGKEMTYSYTFGGVTTTQKVKIPTAGLIPVMVGGKYWFSEMFYGHAQVGMTFVNNGGGSNFTYAPGIGVKFSQIDVAVKYTGMSVKGGGNFNLIGLRAAYNF